MRFNILPNSIHKKGVEVFIPVHSLQMDEKYYAEPEKFKPTRFSDEGGKNLIDRPYLPFGDGPRNCIGMRMGKMQTKVGLVLMMQRYKYALQSDYMKHDMEFDPKLFLLSPKVPVKLRVIKR